MYASSFALLWDDNDVACRACLKCAVESASPAASMAATASAAARAEGKSWSVADTAGVMPRGARVPFLFEYLMGGSDAWCVVHADGCSVRDFADFKHTDD